VQFRYPNGGKIELLEPLGEGFLSRFLERRGEGLHHITFKTDDVAAAIVELESRGYEVVDVDLDDPHWKEAFLRPSKAHGTLIQVAWSSEPDDVAATRMRPPEIDELLAG
jgi:methylmalonyl-CoA/ethylmalonyl-CoA epimerase